jgi:hypothetical protein
VRVGAFLYDVVAPLWGFVSLLMSASFCVG